MTNDEYIETNKTYVDNIEKAIALLEYLHDVSDSGHTRQECRESQNDLRTIAMEFAA